MQYERLTFTRIDCVARICAPLVTHDQVGALGQDIDDLALALIAPLSTYHHHTLGLRSEHSRPLKKAGNAKKKPPRGGLEYPLRETIRRAAPAPVPPRHARRHPVAHAPSCRRGAVRSARGAPFPS